MCARKGNNVCTVSLVELWDLKGVGEKEVKKLFLFSMAVYVCVFVCVCVCVCVCVFAPSNEEAAGRERQDLVSLPRQSLRYKYRFTAKPARELFCPFRHEHGICENKHANAQKNVWVR